MSKTLEEISAHDVSSTQARVDNTTGHVVLRDKKSVGCMNRQPYQFVLKRNYHVGCDEVDEDMLCNRSCLAYVHQMRIVS